MVAAEHSGAILQRALAAEAEAARTRQLFEEYQAALKDEEKKSTLAAKDIETLRGDLEGLKVTLSIAEREKERLAKRGVSRTPPPSTWVSGGVDGGILKLFELGAGSTERIDVEATFLSSLGDANMDLLDGITSIKRVENKSLSCKKIS